MTQESAVTADVVHQSVPQVQPYEHPMLCGHCGTPLDFSVEGDLLFAFCIQCKRVDTQAFVALDHLFVWLQQHEATGRLEFAAFGEIRPWLPPLEKPPVAYPYVRLWQLNYAFADEGTTNKAVLVALQVDGTYVCEQHHYPRCWDTPLSTTCHNYLLPNERGVLACPEHGEYHPEPAQGGK